MSEEKLRIALEVGHMDSWDWDIGPTIIRWSAHLDAPFGLIGGGFGVSYEIFMELVHPQGRTWVDQEMRRALEEGAEQKQQVRIHDINPEPGAICENQ